MIKNSQHTFRHRRSCLTNLLDIFEDNAVVADKKNMTDAVYHTEVRFFKQSFDKVQR